MIHRGSRPWALYLVLLLLAGSLGTGSPPAHPEPPVPASAPEATGESAPEPRVSPELEQGFATRDEQFAILVLNEAQEAGVLAQLAAWDLEFHSYAHLHQASVALPRDRLDDVANLPGVLTLFHNEAMRPYLDQSADYIGANIVWNQFRERGAGVVTLVVDTGIDGTHPDVRYGANLIENVAPTLSQSGLTAGYSEGVPNSDVDGHGTHVAGTIAGTALATGPSDPNRGRFHGIAYESKIVGFAAGTLDPASGEATFDSLNVLEAFNYALANKDRLGIRIVSNSWGANGKFVAESPVNQASLQLYRAGLVVTFAAGNEGDQGPGSLNKYSVAPWVLSVAAGDNFNQRAPFSSIGTDPSDSGLPYDHPDITAPGVQVDAPRASLTTDGLQSGALLGEVTQRPGSLYSAKSGTSMATPHVSGVAALLLADNPDLSPDDVYDILVASAQPMQATAIWEGGAGYMDAFGAYKLAQSVDGNRDQFLEGRMKYAGKVVGDLDNSNDPITVGFGSLPQADAVGLEAAQRFFIGLATTGQGLIFLLGTAGLTLLSFRSERGTVRP